ncbi:flagellar basal body rod protein FlgB [Clostridium ganghwense]|uniref:Flagellar basal body rod protein FlgB n=1 Tax=Clostridium ganghwense TaxID=312089 RepID=A0ABT4CMX3_9CLOT|nr:flagellar basal body rod protein FlgB [Clostridium ganghwense]MCY6370395.1 flagellar basal body rod protein FlgB [Clostridium ganghwense]
MKIDNVSASTRTYELLKKSLNVSSKRKDVIANNIANINTKGYKRHYVTFEENLKEVNKGLELKSTNNKHITDTDKVGEMKIETDKTDSMRMDGNNVDIENETANLAANYLKYNALISEVNARMSMKKTIITGGR